MLNRRPMYVIVEKLSSKLPRSIHLDSLNKLDDDDLESGCRDDVSATGVLKTTAYTERNNNEMISVQLMSENEKCTEDKLIQRNYSSAQGSRALVQQVDQFVSPKVKERHCVLRHNRQHSQKGQMREHTFLYL